MQLGKKGMVVICLAMAPIAGCSGTAVQNVTANPTLAVQPAAEQATAAAQAATSTVAPAAATVAEATLATAPTTAPTAGSPLEALSSAVHTLTAVTSYRMTVTNVGGPASDNGTFTYELAKGGDFHIASSKGEFYRIGDTFYIKQSANAKWLKVTASIGTGLTAGLFAPRDLVTKATTAKNVSLAGPDILNGKPMLVYQYSPDPTQQPNMVSAKLWVGVADGLPYQVIANNKNGGTTTIVFTDYNASINLTPPIP
jgi:hypothetical protein